MDNLINSIVGDVASNAGNASGLQDYQGKSYDPKTILSLAKQITASIDPNAVKGGVFSTKGESVGFNYDQATNLLGHPPSAAEQVALDMARHLSNEGVTDLNNVDATTTNRRFGSTYTGGGGTIYEIKKDADGKPVISTWSKDTSNKKTILTALAVAAAAFGIPGVTEGLLSGAPAGATVGTLGAEAAGTAFELANAGAGAFEGGSALSSLAGTGAGSAFELANAGAGAFEGGTALNSLAAMTPAELASFESMNAGATAMTDLGASELANAGATAMSDLGASELANAGASANTAANVANAGNAVNTASTVANAANAAKTLIDPITGLVTSAAGNVLANRANQEGITDARNLINEYGTRANDRLTSTYADARDLGAAGRRDLNNIFTNQSTNLNNIINAQAGVYGDTNTNLANNYSNLNTNLNNTINAQAGVYGDTNTALENTYNDTTTNLKDLYDTQVGYQQKYQDVGNEGAQGLIDNQDYLTKQFGTADLYSGLAPNYQFMLGQGQMANQRAGNMSGGALGGNALQGLQKYTQDYAGNAYQQAFNNFQGQRQNIYNTLSGMANIGTTSAGQLTNLGNTYGSNMGSLSSNYGNARVSNAGQMQNAYNQYGSNLTSGSNAYAGNMVNNANTMQGAYNQYGSNLNNAANTFGSNLTNNYATGVNAANVAGLNAANLAVGVGGALASNATAAGANNATALSNLGNTALLGSMIKAT
jgi:hypothetical protein